MELGGRGLWGVKKDDNLKGELYHTPKLAVAVHFHVSTNTKYGFDSAFSFKGIMDIKT